MNIVPDTIAAFREQYPTLNPFGIYCLFTGRLIGSHPAREIHELIESMNGDPDERADDLAMRLLASCRPSLRWNHLRVTDITSMRRTHPVETLCYLINGSSAPRINDDYFDEMMARIGLFATLSTAPFEAIECLYFDFYVDAEESISETQLSTRRMRNWLESTDRIGHAAQRAKRIVAIEAEAALIREGKIKRALRPVSERTLKKREHDQKLTMANAFLDSILQGLATPVAPSPTPEPVKRPAGAGFRIATLAKGS
jgi:hypothetical protein